MLGRPAAGIVVLALSLPALLARAQTNPPRAIYHCGVPPAAAPIQTSPGGPLFPRAAIALPPIVYANPARTFWEVMLLYWQTNDPASDSRVRLLAPLFLEQCTPTLRMGVSPLFGWRSDADGTAGFALNYYFRRDRDHQTDVLFPLFYRFGARGSDGLMHTTAGGLLPLVFAGSDENRSYLYLPALLTFYRRDAESQTLVLGPLYHHRDPESLRFGLPPLFLHRSARGLSDRHYTVIPPLLAGHFGEYGEETTVVGTFFYRTHDDDWDAGLFPLVFAGRHGDKRYTLVLPPLVMDWRDSDNTVTVAGPVFHRRHPHGWDAGLFPLLFTGERDGTKYFTTVPPLAIHVSQADGTKLTVAGPVYHRTTAAGARQSGLFPLVFNGHTVDGTDYTAIPPLLALHRTQGNHETTVIGPAFRDSHGVDDWDAGVFPILFTGQRSEKHYSVIPPLGFVHTGDGQHETTVSLPFYHRKTPYRWDAGLVPLFYAGENGDSHYSLVLPPLIMDFGDATSHTTVLGPFYRRRTPRWTHAGVFPLVMHGFHGTTEYTTVPPLLALHVEKGDEKTTLLGPMFHRRRPGHWDAGVFPVAFAGAHDDKSYAVVPPLGYFHRRTADSDTTISMPFYHSRRGEEWDAGLLPLVFTGHHLDSRYTLVAPPLVMDIHTRDADTTVTGPFYRRQSRGWTHVGVFPLVLHGFERWGRREYTVLPPLLTFHVESADSQTTVLGPIYHHSGRSGWDAGILPLAYAGAHGDSRYAVVAPPLLLWIDQPQSKFLLAGPFYRSVEKGRTQAGLIPVAFHGTTESGTRYTVIPPLGFVHTDDGKSSTTAAMLGFHVRNPDGYDAGVFPLVFNGRRGDSHYTVIPPLGFAHTDDGKKSTTVALLGFHQRTPEGHDAGVFPLVFNGRRGDSRYTVVPPLGFFHTDDGKRSTTAALLGFHHREPGGYDAGLFPLVFNGRHGDSRYRLVAPPLVMHFESARGSTTIAGPVFHHREGQATSAGVFPLLFFKKDGPDHRLTLLPLFHESRSGRERTVVAPLFYHHDEPGASQDVLFPLVWSTRSRDSRSLVGFPLVWDFHDRKSDTRLTLALPFYVRYRKAGDATNVVLNVVWTRGRTPAGENWSYHVFPLVSVESTEPGHLKWQVLRGLAGYERAGDWERRRIFWVWTQPQPLARRRVVARGPIRARNGEAAGLLM